jgi:serine-type D-Ala-D-Ala carboxypeptidase
LLEKLTAKPEALGLEAQKLKRMDALIRDGMAAGWYPAAAYAVLRHGQVAASGAMGIPQPQIMPKRAATPATLFDMASLTKTVTAVLLLHAVEEGLLHLGQSVTAFLPEAVGTPIAAASLRHLATHTSGLPAWKPLYKSTTKSPLADILNTSLDADPGTRYTYSDLGYILLGTLLPRIWGKPLDVLAQERIFTPLGMTRTYFLVPDALKPDCAATAHCPLRPNQILVGEVHDANAHHLGGVSGHAGLFSTLDDMTRYAVALFAPTMANHHGLPRLLSPTASRIAFENQIEPSIGGHSIGWFTHPNGMLPRGDLLSKRTIGHTGFTGTLLVHDPENDLTFLFLTNRVYSEADGAGLLKLRRLLANVLGAALTG